MYLLREVMLGAGRRTVTTALKAGGLRGLSAMRLVKVPWAGHAA
jgi:hypothetical protein